MEMRNPVAVAIRGILAEPKEKSQEEIDRLRLQTDHEWERIFWHGVDTRGTDNPLYPTWDSIPFVMAEWWMKCGKFEFNEKKKRVIWSQFTNQNTVNKINRAASTAAFAEKNNLMGMLENFGHQDYRAKRVQTYCQLCLWFHYFHPKLDFK